MTARSRRNNPETAGIRRRLEELKGVLPSLAGLPELQSANVLRVLEQLTIEVERLRRQSIRDQIQLAGLQELLESLLHGGDPERDLLTVVGYLVRVAGLREVLLARRRPEGRWIGYHAGPAGAGPERIPLADPFQDRTSGGSVVPLRYACVLRLGPESGSSGAGAQSSEDLLGILCLTPEEDEASGGGDGWNPGEIGRRVEGMLRTLAHREALEGAARLRRQLVGSMGDGLLALDPEGMVIEVNEAAARLLRVSPGGCAGRPLSACDGAPAEFLRVLNQALGRQGAPPPGEFTFGSPEDPVPVNVTVRLLQGDRGDFRGLVVNLTDLSAVRALEAENRRLDRLATLGRFAAWVAHEIRNPLAGIGAGVEYLGRSLAGEESREDLRFVREEVQRLNRIVSDLLDYTRPRPLSPQPVEPDWLIAQVRRGVEPLLAARKIGLCTKGPSGLLLEADPDRLHQVLLNLVRNAIEASGEGSEVVVQWDRRDAPGEPMWIRFRVIDHGAGMTPEQQARAFEPFYTSKSGGTGLGLYLAHSIVEQHGGRLLLRSRPGEGTTVCLELPAETPERCKGDAVVHLDR